MAADGGAGVYLLGKRGPLAAFIPKPGLYLTNDIYFYDAGRDTFLPLGGRVAQDVAVEALINIAQFTWVTDRSVLGGRLAFSGVLPYGNVDVTAAGIVAFDEGGNAARVLSDDVTGFGDPTFGAALGWKHRDGDRFRAWSGYASVFVPVGDYEVGRLANIGKNRWALDVGGAYTMANFQRGRELSAVLGVTFNGNNEDTGYNTGTEMHFELAAVQHLPKNWSIGVVGYWYEQLTGDGNNPAILGDFKGRAIAIGPQVSHQLGNVGVNLRWYHEFEVRNRVEGDAVFLTFSIPLSIRPPQDETQDWTSDTKGPSL